MLNSKKAQKLLQKNVSEFSKKYWSQTLSTKKNLSLDTQTSMSWRKENESLSEIKACEDDKRSRAACCVQEKTKATKNQNTICCNKIDFLSV